jgi:hypothetical protein
MSTLDEAVRLLVLVQDRNARLSGEDLTRAADRLAAACEGRRVMVGVDATGDRIIGAALVLHPSVCRPAVATARVDGLDVLLVSGALAGPFGLLRAAEQSLRLGANSVEAAVLDGWSEEIPGIGRTLDIGVGAVGAGTAATAA